MIYSWLGRNHYGTVFALGFQIFENNLRCNWIRTLQANMKRTFVQNNSQAMAIGFEIPATLISNDQEAAHDFYDAYDGDTIVKALSHHSGVAQG